jgi:hypothetical protein
MALFIREGVEVTTLTDDDVYGWRIISLVYE